jgi:2'-5' RNA ligase
MSSRQQLFFIALLPSAEVQTKVREIQQYCAEVYHSRAALKSPPHITLQPPFKWSLDDYSRLMEHLQQFVLTQLPIPMILDSFAAFKPRVIYIKVIKTPALLAIYKNILAYLESNLNIVDPLAKTRPFAPHLTVAFRDLTKPNFYQAWSEFADKSLYFEFIIPQLTLLQHNGKQWEIAQEFLFYSVTE